MTKLDDVWPTITDKQKEDVKKFYDYCVADYRSKACAVEFAEKLALNDTVANIERILGEDNVRV
jgi:hypothetical protein